MCEHARAARAGARARNRSMRPAACAVATRGRRGCSGCRPRLRSGRSESSWTAATSRSSAKRSAALARIGTAAPRRSSPPDAVQNRGRRDRRRGSAVAFSGGPSDRGRRDLLGSREFVLRSPGRRRACSIAPRKAASTGLDPVHAPLVPLRSGSGIPRSCASRRRPDDAARDHDERRRRSLAVRHRRLEPHPWIRSRCSRVSSACADSPVLYPAGHPAIDAEARRSSTTLIQQHLRVGPALRIDVIHGDVHLDGVSFRPRQRPARRSCAS